ncbi:MAG TPA: proton-conducting transporter membrane subunit [Roseiflexaceae bacterium]|nr:proton-conducting transporter membrane subunit [Roseiflexaceae bacterium]
MLILAFAFPLLVALLCLALNQRVTTRALGLSAAAGAAVAGGSLLAAVAQGERDLSPQDWAATGDTAFRLSLSLDGLSLGPALLICFGGALALAALALALPARLRGFGGLFAALLLTLMATLAGIMLQESTLLPVAWALVAVLTFAALRASGTQSADPPLPIGLLAGLLSALALLGAALALRDLAPTDPPSLAVLVGWTLATLLAFGAAPLHGAFEEITAVPTGLAAPLLALGLPLLAGVALLREAAALVDLLPIWRTTLTGLGLLALLCCSAGALRERRVNRILGWLFSAQLGLVLVALGQPSPVPTSAAPALLLNAALTTLTAYLAFEPLERSAGTDNLADLPARGRMAGPWLAMLIAAASAVGLPGTWGFWARQWLFGAPEASAVWMGPLLLAGSALMVVAYLAPLATLWRAGGEQPSDGGLRAAQICGLAAGLPLLALGAVPQLAWQTWGAQAQTALIPDVTTTPQLPGLAGQIAGGLAALGLLALPALLGNARRRPLRDPEERSGIQTPDALGESLRGLAWVGAPTGLFEGALAGLLAFSRGLRRLLALFEQRYYMAGLIVALIAVILLML